MDLTLFYAKSRKLDKDQTTNMIKSTRIRPNERSQRIRELCTMLDLSRNEYLEAFRIEVAEEMTVVPARVLSAPQVQYKDSVSVIPQHGYWKVRIRRHSSNTTYICLDAGLDKFHCFVSGIPLERWLKGVGCLLGVFLSTTERSKCVPRPADGCL